MLCGGWPLPTCKDLDLLFIAYSSTTLQEIRIMYVTIKHFLPLVCHAYFWKPKHDLGIFLYLGCECAVCYTVVPRNIDPVPMIFKSKILKLNLIKLHDLLVVRQTSNACSHCLWCIHIYSNGSQLFYDLTTCEATLLTSSGKLPTVGSELDPMSSSGTEGAFCSCIWCNIQRRFPRDDILWGGTYRI